MKTIQLQSKNCMVCGGKLVKTMSDPESYTCEHCGEKFNLEMLSKMELEFDEFDKLLLLDLKMRKGKFRSLSPHIN